MEISANEYKISIGRVVLDSELTPYKLVIKVEFLNDIKLMIKKLSLGEVENLIIANVLDYLNNSEDIKKLGIELSLTSYFNKEIEMSNNRILYSFIIRETQGYKDWLKGKDIIWYTESEVERYDHV